MKLRILYTASQIGLVLSIILIMVSRALPVLAQTTGPLDLVLLIDSSDSTGGVGRSVGTGTDPQNLRTGAAQFLLDYVQAVGDTQGVTHRFAVANFNSQLTYSRTLQALQGNIAQESLRASSDGGTDFRPPFKFVEDLRKEFSSTNPMAVVLFTDGNPDPAPNRDIYFDELQKQTDALRQAGVQIFVVAVGKATDDTSHWTRLVSTAHYRSISATTDLAGVYREFLAEMLGLNSEESVRNLTDGSEQTITVEPYLEQVVFSVFKDKANAQVALQDPNGAVVPPSRGGTPKDKHVVYSISTPALGEWVVKIKGGTGQLWVDRRWPTLSLEAPRGPQAVNTVLDVTGKLVRRGQPVNEAKLTLELIARPSVGQPARIDMGRGPDGRYLASVTDLSAEGTYTFTVNARLEEQLILAHVVPVTVSVFTVPSLTTLDVLGDKFVSQPVTVTAQISNSQKVGPNTIIVVRVKDSGEQVIGTVDLRRQNAASDLQSPEGLFVGTTSLPQISGQYRFEGMLQGRTADGVNLTDSSVSMQVKVQPPASPVVPVVPVIPVVPSLPPDFTGAWLALLGFSVIAAVVTTYAVSSRLKRSKNAPVESPVSESELQPASLGEPDEIGPELDERLTYAESARDDNGRHHGAAEESLDEPDAGIEQPYLAEPEPPIEKPQSKETEDRIENAKQLIEKAEALVNRGDLSQSDKDEVTQILDQAQEAVRGQFNHNGREALAIHDRILSVARRIGAKERYLHQINQSLSHPPGIRLVVLKNHLVGNPTPAALYLALADNSEDQLKLLTELSNSKDLPIARVCKFILEARMFPSSERLHRVSMAAQALSGTEPSWGYVVAAYELMKTLKEVPPLSSEVSAAFGTALAPLQADRNEHEDVLTAPEALWSVITGAHNALILPVGNEATLDWLQQAHDQLRRGEEELFLVVDLPERQFFLRTIRRWRDYVESRMTLWDSPSVIHSGELSVTVQPSLAIGAYEEGDILAEFEEGNVARDFRNHSDRHVCVLPLLLQNTGNLPIDSIKVSLTIKNGNATIAPNPYLLHERILGGEVMLIKFDIEALEPTDLDLKITYRREIWDSFARRIQQETIEQPMTKPIATVGRLVIEAGEHSLANPYTPDIPLNNLAWEKLATGNARSTVDQIMVELQSVEQIGRLIAIRGLRRSGKTTILRQIMRRARQIPAQSGDTQHPKFLVVDVDLMEWLEEQNDQLPSPDQSSALDQTLWQKILVELDLVLKQSEIVPLLSESFQDQLFSAVKDEQPVSSQKLRTILQGLQQQTGRHLVLVLDEADAFASGDLAPLASKGPIYNRNNGKVKVSPPKHKRSRRSLIKVDRRPTLLSNIGLVLRRLVDTAGTVVILAHENAEAGWERDFYNLRRTDATASSAVYGSVLKPVFKRTRLFEDHEVKTMIKAGPLTYTDLAIETVVRFTGGYPALVQLLGYYLIEMARTKRSEFQSESKGVDPAVWLIVTVEDVKRAIADMNTSADWSPFIDYLRYGFRLEELRLLITLSVGGFVQPDFGVIEGVRCLSGSWEGLDWLLAVFKRDHPDFAKETNTNTLRVWMDRLKDKEIFRIDESGNVWWRVGWLYVLMQQISKEVFEATAQSATPTGN